MRRLVIASLLGAALALGSLSPAFGAIHPIVSSECAAALASAVADNQDPVGQVPDNELAFFLGQVPATGSDLRALIATGVILVDADGFFAGVDFTRMALRGDSGASHCPNA